MTACARGTHLFEHGPDAVLTDWLAWPLLGGDAESIAAGLRTAFGDCTNRLATWIAARSRISEDWLTTTDAEQYVVLGAGLDTFAWRQPPAAAYACSRSIILRHRRGSDLASRH